MLPSSANRSLTWVVASQNHLRYPSTPDPGVATSLLLDERRLAGEGLVVDRHREAEVLTGEERWVDVHKVDCARELGQ